MRAWWPHLFSWPHFLDPVSWWWLSTKGYAFTSSGLQLTVPFGLLVWARKHNCHSAWCFRFGHPHPEHGHPVCRRHYHDSLKTG